MGSTPIFGDPRSPFAPNFAMMIEFGMKSFYTEGCTAEVASVLALKLRDLKNCDQKPHDELEDDEILDFPFDLLYIGKDIEHAPCSSDIPNTGQRIDKFDGNKLHEVDLFVDISETSQAVAASQECPCSKQDQMGIGQNSPLTDALTVGCKSTNFFEPSDKKDVDKTLAAVGKLLKASATLSPRNKCHGQPKISVEVLDNRVAGGHLSKCRTSSADARKTRHKSRDLQVEVNTCTHSHSHPAFENPSICRLEAQPVTGSISCLYEIPSNPYQGNDRHQGAALDSQGVYPFKYHNFGGLCHRDDTWLPYSQPNYTQFPFTRWGPAHSTDLFWANSETSHSLRTGYYQSGLQQQQEGRNSLCLNSPLFSQDSRLESSIGLTDLNCFGRQASTHTDVFTSLLSPHLLATVPVMQQPQHGTNFGLYGENGALSCTNAPVLREQVPISSPALSKPLDECKADHYQSGPPEVELGRDFKDGYKFTSHLNQLTCKKDSTLNVLLEGVKSWTSTKLQIEDLYGYMVELCKDQAGSRFIQQQLECASEKNFTECFEELSTNMFILMLDPFGNYVIQKLFDRGSPEQIQSLGDKLKNKVLTLSLHMYGSRVMQKALETLGLKMKTSLARELKGHVPECIKDRSGNYVIQKCIICLSTSCIGFIVEPLMEQASALATHSYGCRVIQRLLEYCDDDEQKIKLVDKILKHRELLTQDQYGNYVIQHVFEHGTTEQRSRVVQYLSQNIVPLSIHKFASNVVERCLLLGNELERRHLICSILNRDGQRSVGPLHDMMKDRYGNFVVQRLLEVSNEAQREEILKCIYSRLNELKRITYGKHLLGRVQGFNQNEPLLDDNHMLSECTWML